MPAFAHLPLLLKPEGSGKLSKRDADKHGFPIFPIEWHDPITDENITGFREHGYLPEALINFIALLGWNPGNDDEEFSLGQLTETFDLKRINKAGAKFDIEKAKWFNQTYLKKQPLELLAGKFNQQVKQEGYDCSEEKASEIISLLLDRATFFSDFWNLGQFIFVEPNEYDEQMARKKWNKEIADVLASFADKLSDSLVESADDTKQLLWQVANEQGLGLGKVMPGLRLAMTGSSEGPDLMGTIRVLGAKETSERIQKAITALN